jgi:type IX secretion system PorP/SprF family membrane protein
MYRGITTLVLFVFSTLIGKSQDTQYSQFYAYPVYMNAALSGSHSGTYRVSSAYRSQWAQSLERPFTSFSMAGDFKIDVAPNKKSSDFAGAGLIFSTDQIGIFNYDVYQIALMGAYHKLLSARNNTYLSAGVHFGLGQRSINYNSVSFEDQFNGQDAYSFATGELLPANNFAHPDLGFGLNFSTTPSKNLGFYVGGSYYHLNEPNISFYARDVDVEVPQENATLHRRLTLHAAVSVPLTDLVTLLPRAIYNSQGQHASATFGTNLRFQLIEADALFFHLGAWARSTRSLSVFQPTDATVYAGFELRGLMIGLSYDIYLREIAGEVGTGTFEFTISFTGSHENSAQICPSF